MSKNLTLGYAGEYGARAMTIDLYEEATLWPDATPKLLLCRPGEDVPYVFEDTTYENSCLTFTPRKVDTAIAGTGYAQVYFYGADGALLGKSGMMTTLILRAMSGDVTQEPSAEQKSYYDNLMEQVALAVAAGQTAPGYAQSAAESAAAAAVAQEAAEAAASSVTITTDEINAAGNAALSAIEQKGANTLASIPEEYTALSSDVSSLKEQKADAIVDVTERAKYHEIHAQDAPFSVTLYGTTDGLDTAVVDISGDEYILPILPDGAPLYGNTAASDTVQNRTDSECDRVVTFDGTEGWTLSGAGWFYLDRVLEDAACGTSVSDLSHAMYANRMKQGDPVNNTATNIFNVWITNAAQGIRRIGLRADATTLDAFKASFAANPLQIWYKSTSYDPANKLKACETARQWKTVAMNGSENWQMSAAGWFYLDGQLVDASANSAVGVFTANLYSDDLPVGNPATDAADCFNVWMSNSARRIGVKLTSASTLAEFKAHLAVNPLNISYTLVTPQIYYASPVLMKKPDTFTDEPVKITSSGETVVEYAHDTKHYIDTSRFAPDEYTPVLELTGDTTGMSKDDAVELDYKFNGMSGKCTVKWQGSSSLQWPKKNYTIKFDTAFEAKAGWGAEKKYCAKANYIDFSHARNVCCAKLWGQIVKSRSNPPDKISGLVNGGAIDGFPISITINGENMGLFTLNIPKDGWMYGMGDGNREAIVCADTHVAATQFRGLATLNGDFELEYVSDENDSAWVLTSLNTLINSVMGATSSNLDTTVAQYLDWDSAIDYYIFTCLVQGLDMTDKNYLLYTFDGVKWGFGAYDMDSTFGLYWDGTFFYPDGHNPTFDYYATLHRVMALIKTVKTDALKERYAQLRKNVLSEANLAWTFSNFTASIPKRCLDEEVKLWPRIPSTAANNLHQILDYYRMRVAIMDEEIAAL